MDDLRPDLRAAVDALRTRESPSAEAVGRGRSRLEAAIGAGAPAAGSWLGKALAVAAGATAVAGAIWWGTANRATTPQPAPAPRARAAVPPAPAEPTPEAVQPSVQPDPVQPTMEPVATDEPKSKRAKPQRPAKAGSDLEAELALIKAASVALRRGDPVKALAAVEKHARKFPRGALAGERELTRARAHCAAGDENKARRVADRWIKRHSSSHLVSRFEKVCQK